MARSKSTAFQSENPPPSRRALIFAATTVALVLFLVYHATLIRTVIDQDSGELVAAAHVLGIAHPTGYPLWVLLGRVFDFLPMGGTSAYRVALLSAFSAAAACGIVTALAIRLTAQLLPAIFAGLACGLWFPMWSQAVRAEVYGLTALLVALALMAFIEWDEERSPRKLAWFALACGFVFMHHRTALGLLGPGLLVGIALMRPRRVRTTAGVLALFLAPLIFYAYLPIRAAQRPPVNWTDPSTLDRFLTHILASQYTQFALANSPGQMVEEGVKLLPQILLPTLAPALIFALIAIPLIVWGWWVWLRRQPIVAGSLALGALALIYWVLGWGETTDLKVFLVPLGSVFALGGALGLSRLAKLFHRPLFGAVAVGLTGLLVCTLQLAGNWSRADLSRMWGHRDRWAVVLRQMEPNAVFVSDFDVPSFATLYLQNVEGLRKDITLIRSVRMSDQWYVDLIADPELRTNAQEAWNEASAITLQIHDRTALFAHRLAERLQGKRPIYCLHLPPTLQLPSPPYFISLNEELVALRSIPPDIECARSDSTPLASYPGGLQLSSARFTRDHFITSTKASMGQLGRFGLGYEIASSNQAGAGEMLAFTTTWALQESLAPIQFGVALIPEGIDPSEFDQSLRPSGRFVQGFPVLYGRYGTPPSPEGVAYQQHGTIIIPSNAPPGDYQVAIGVGPPYTEVYNGWVEVGRLRVTAAPLPTNPP